MTTKQDSRQYRPRKSKRVLISPMMPVIGASRIKQATENEKECRSQDDEAKSRQHIKTMQKALKEKEKQKEEKKAKLARKREGYLKRKKKHRTKNRASTGVITVNGAEALKYGALGIGVMLALIFAIVACFSDRRSGQPEVKIVGTVESYASPDAMRDAMVQKIRQQSQFTPSR